jgi:hypothetical protein
MMRLFGYALGILLLATAQQVMAQAQVTFPPAEKQKAPAGEVDAAIDADQLAEIGSSLDPWLQHQADDLLDVVGCYLG